MSFPKIRFLFIFSIIYIILFGYLFIPNTKAATPSSLLINVAPENPAPFENTTITLNSYASNLDSVLITWYVNGKTSLSGIGKKTFTTKAPDAGKETSIKVSVYLPEGNIETNIVLRPSVMVLLWQADDSHVPPFYKGKALATPESRIKVVAMPEIRDGKNIVSPQNMTYSWKNNYENNVDGSGYGKNYFTFSNDYLDDSSTISVTAQTVDQKYSSSANISINNTNPEIIFYKKDSVLGTIWEKDVEDGHQITDTEVIQAEPYFISPKQVTHPFLVWNWYINDNMINVSEFRKNSIPLKVQPDIHGTSTIKLEINNTNKIFETAKKEINVQF